MVFCREMHWWWKLINWHLQRLSFHTRTILFLIVVLNISLTAQRISVKFFVVIESRTLPLWFVSFLITSWLFLLYVLLMRDLYVWLSVLQFKMRESQMCAAVCRVQLDKKSAKALKEKIADEYRVNMWGIFIIGFGLIVFTCSSVFWTRLLFLWCRILDNLPLVVPVKRPDQDNVVVYQHGFHVGLKGIFVGVSALIIIITTSSCIYVLKKWVMILSFLHFDFL